MKKLLFSLFFSISSRRMGLDTERMAKILERSQNNS